MTRITAWTKDTDGWSTASSGPFPTPLVTPIFMRSRAGWGYAALAWKTAERKGGEQVSTERRYYLTSLPGEARAFGAAVRSHWGVENGLALGTRHRLSRRCQSHAQGPQSAELCRLATYGPQPLETGTDCQVWHQSQEAQSWME